MQWGPGWAWCPQAGSREQRAHQPAGAWADPGNQPSRRAGGSRTPSNPQPRAALRQTRGCLALPGLCCAEPPEPPAPPGTEPHCRARGRLPGARGQPGRGTSLDQQDTGLRSQPGDGILPFHPLWTAPEPGFPPHTLSGHGGQLLTDQPAPRAPSLSLTPAGLEPCLLLRAHLCTPTFLGGPDSQHVRVGLCGDRVFTEVIKVK